jgi:hypothetical protein
LEEETMVWMKDGLAAVGLFVFILWSFAAAHVASAALR